MSNTTYAGSSMPSRMVVCDTDYTVLAADCYGGLIVANGAACAFTLPASAAGMRIACHAMTAHAIMLKPNGNEYVAYASCDAQDWLVSDGTIGALICLACEVAGVWQVLGDPKATWSRTAKP